MTINDINRVIIFCLFASIVASNVMTTSTMASVCDSVDDYNCLKH